MIKFSGIPGGKLTFTPLPGVLFSELFPEIDGLAELKLTLHIYHLLYRKKGSTRYVTLPELQADRTLRRGLMKAGSDPESLLLQGLAKAIERGPLVLGVDGGQEVFYFNTEETRRELERRGGGGTSQVRNSVKPGEPAAERPNIFKLYEENIGLLTPMIGEELKEAEKEYPPDWIVDAFRIAVENNVRKWSYVRAILEDWTREGKNETTGRDPKKGRTWYNRDEAKFIKR